MSDCCHCIAPKINSTKHKDAFCEICGLWYIDEAWRTDPRRLRAEATHSKTLMHLYAAKNKVGRNDLCPCGSGIKYKKCCLNKPI